MTRSSHDPGRVALKNILTHIGFDDQGARGSGDNNMTLPPGTGLSTGAIATGYYFAT